MPALRRSTRNRTPTNRDVAPTKKSATKKKATSKSGGKNAAAAAGGVNKAAVAQIYAKFILGMFGFFACGMLYSHDKMFGPDAMHWTLQYWENQNPSVVGEWWARNFAIFIIAFLAAPFWAGTPMDSHLKCTMVAMTGLLLNFMMIIFVANDGAEATKMVWYPQLGLQVVIVAVNAWLIM